MAFDPNTLAGLTSSELRQVLEQATTQLARAQQSEAQAAADGRQQIAQAVGVLDALLGSLDASPYDPASAAPATIRGVRKHDQATLAAHSGLVHALTLEGLEILAVTVREIALIVGKVSR